MNKIKKISMNNLGQRFLKLVSIYAKIEIVGGLILVMIVLGYLVMTKKDLELDFSIPHTSPTIQQ